MLLSDNIWVLINYMSFVQWLSVGASVLGMVYLRYKKPEMPRPIKVSIKCVDRSQKYFGNCLGNLKLELPFI